MAAGAIRRGTAGVNGLGSRVYVAGHESDARTCARLARRSEQVRLAPNSLPHILYLRMPPVQGEGARAPRPWTFGQPHAIMTTALPRLRSGLLHTEGHGTVPAGFIRRHLRGFRRKITRTRIPVASQTVLAVVGGIIGTFFGRIASSGLVRCLKQTMHGASLHSGLQQESVCPLAGE
jgi:hypothetical protein